MADTYTRYKWVIAACPLIIVFLVAVFRGDRSAGVRIEFVVPNGFHGIFVVEEDAESGSPPQEVDGVVRYVIPKSGVLITTDAESFYDWHSESARYANGQEIPLPQVEAEKQHFLIGLSGDHRRRNLWLIGTRDEARRWWGDHVEWFEINSPEE